MRKRKRGASERDENKTGFSQSTIWNFCLVRPVVIFVGLGFRGISYSKYVGYTLVCMLNNVFFCVCVCAAYVFVCLF